MGGMEYATSATKWMDYGTSNTIDITRASDSWSTYAWAKQDKYEGTGTAFQKEYLSDYTVTCSGSLYNSDEMETKYATTIAESAIRYYRENAYERMGLDWAVAKTTWSAPVASAEERLRQMIRERMAPTIIIRGKKRKSLSLAIDEREERARQTLRRIVGEQGFRKFMRDGFITVVPKSGLTYRIYPGHGVTDVYDRGIMVDRLCVVLQGDFPPTDSLIMRYLLILNDEGEFSKFAVKHTVFNSDANLVFPGKQDSRSLAEVWSEIKAVA